MCTNKKLIVVLFIYKWKAWGKFFSGTLLHSRFFEQYGTVSNTAHRNTTECKIENTVYR